MGATRFYSTLRITIIFHLTAITSLQANGQIVNNDITGWREFYFGRLFSDISKLPGVTINDRLCGDDGRYVAKDAMCEVLNIDIPGDTLLRDTAFHFEKQTRSLKRITLYAKKGSGVSEFHELSKLITEKYGEGEIKKIGNGLQDCGTDPIYISNGITQTFDRRSGTISLKYEKRDFCPGKYAAGLEPLTWPTLTIDYSRK